MQTHENAGVTNRTAKVDIKSREHFRNTRPSTSLAWHDIKTSRRWITLENQSVYPQPEVAHLGYSKYSSNVSLSCIARSSGERAIAVGHDAVVCCYSKTDYRTAVAEHTAPSCGDFFYPSWSIWRRMSEVSGYPKFKSAANDGAE